jgi:hypothetical protein
LWTIDLKIDESMVILLLLLLYKNMARLLIFTVIIILLLIGCNGVSLLPTSELVQKAITIQLAQTQQQLNQKLDLDFRGFEIQQLLIAQEKFIKIQKLPTYRIQGTYNLVFKLPKRRLTQQQKSFEVYLQLQHEGKTWRLLLPEKRGEDATTIWRSYLIP